MSLAGKFLVAKPILRDPNFARCVVVLLAHNDEGALGLIVNRPAATEELPLPLFDGGPCASAGLFLLHGNAAWTDGEGPQEIAPGVFVGDAGVFERAGKSGPEMRRRVRVFRGYAGWGGGQLERELAVGDWAVMPASGELLFDTPVADLWKHLVPPMIPQPSMN
jgi:putative transcriptional regulator